MTHLAQLPESGPGLPPLQAATTKEAGFALLESLLAILIFSLGILALVGFQAAAIRQSGEARQRADAAFIANQMESDMWGVDPGNLSGCAGTFTASSGTSCAGNWQERLAALPNSSAEVVVNNSTVTLTITWKMPGETDAHKHIHVADIRRNL